MHARELRLRHLTLRATGDVRADRADRVQRVAERLAQLAQPLTRLLQRRERDERAQDLVRPLEDEVDARVADGLLVRVFLRVTDASRDLQRVVRRAVGELAREDLARRRLEREVDAAAVDHARGEHRSRGEY